MPKPAQLAAANRPPRPWLITPKELIALRKAAFLDQRTLAKTIGVGRSTIQNYEKGIVPAPKYVILLLHVLAAKRKAMIQQKRQDLMEYLDAHIDVSI